MENISNSSLSDGTDLLVKFRTARKAVKKNSESLKSGDGRPYKKIARRAHGGRAVSLKMVISNVLYRRLRISKKIISPLVDEALEIARSVLLEDNVDLLFPGLGTIESENLETRPFFHSKSGITTWFPPGSVKITFRPQQRIRALGKPKFIHKLANGWFVYPWYSHLYKQNGEPIIESDEWLDRETVKINMFSAMKSLRDKNREMRGNK